MSEKTLRRAAFATTWLRCLVFDRKMRRAVALVLAARVWQMASGFLDPYVETGLTLVDLVNAASRIYLAMYFLVPVFVYAASSGLEGLMESSRLVRGRSKASVALSYLRVSLAKAAVMALVVSVTGAVLVALATAGEYGAPEMASLVAEQAVRQTIFFLACAMLVLVTFLATRSLVLATAATLMYGALDFMLSIIAPTFYALRVSWRRASVTGARSALELAGSMAPLVAIVLACLAACVLMLRHRELLAGEGSSRPDRAKTGPRLWLPVRPGYGIRLGVALLAAAVLSLLLGGSPRQTMRYLFAGGAFLPVSPPAMPPIWQMVGSAALVALVCYQLCDFLGEGLAAEGPLVLPRAGSRRCYAAVRVAQLAFLSAAYGAVAPCLGVAVSLLRSSAINEGLVTDLVWTVAFSALSMVVLCLVTNLLALMVDAVVACVAVAGVHLATLFACVWVPQDLLALLAPWLPSTNALLALHGSAGLEGFSEWWSLAYLTVLLVLLVAKTLAAVRTQDVF